MSCIPIPQGKISRIPKPGFAYMGRNPTPFQKLIFSLNVSKHKGTNIHLTFFCRTYFDSSSRRLVTKSHPSQSSQPAVRPISWTSDYLRFIRRVIYPSIYPSTHSSIPWSGQSLNLSTSCQSVQITQFFNQTDYQLRSILVSLLKRRVAIGHE